VNPVRRLLTATLVAVAFVVIAASATASAAPTNSSTQHLRAPRQVKAGQVFHFTATGFRPKTPLILVAQDSEHVGTNGGSVLLKPEGNTTFWTDKNGSLHGITRLPTSYFICAGADDCEAQPIAAGSRMLLQISRDGAWDGYAKTWITIAG